VTDPNDDELDRWLNKDVELLPPAPGTFERVRSRARQRKARQALASAAALAVVIVGGVSTPAIISSLTSQGGHAPGQETLADGSSGTISPSASPSSTLTPQPQPSPATSSPLPSSSPTGKLSPSALSSHRAGAAVAGSHQDTGSACTGMSGLLVSSTATALDIGSQFSPSQRSVSTVEKGSSCPGSPTNSALSKRWAIRSSESDRI